MALATLIARSAPAQAGPLVIECHRSDQLSVRFQIAPRATIADTDWITFEFDNHTEHPIELGELMFQIREVEVFDRATGNLVCTKDIGSGNARDLLPTQGYEPVMLPPGCTAAARWMNDQTAGMLGAPPAGGWRVRAHLWFGMGALDKPVTMPPIPGIAFDFEWLPPDEVGVQLLRERLAELQAARQLPDPSQRLLRTLLAMPEVGGVVPLATLLAVREVNNGFRGPWHPVRAHLHARFATNAELADWLLERLRSLDPSALEDFAAFWSIWRPDFLPELVRRHERGEHVLRLLEGRNAPHRDDPAVCQRLARGARSQLPAAVPKFDTMKPETRRNLASQLRTWITDIGMARDRSALPRLTPWLSCKEAWTELLVSRPEPREHRRVCDAALDAVLRVLGDDLAATYADDLASHAGSASPQPEAAGRGGARIRRRVTMVSTWPALDAQHDRMIERLQLRLAERR
ncbi:MAG: hypothetical protein ABIP94_12840 [Planctomycetota bacterium]